MKIESEEGQAHPSSDNVVRDRSHLRQAVLHLQFYGLATITVLSFFPRMFRVQERAFFLLFVVAIGFA